MWVHSFDSKGDVNRQFQILRRTGDAYVCQLYSLEDGYRSELKIISRKEIINTMTIYSSIWEMNDALDRNEEEKEKRLRRQNCSQPAPQPQPNIDATMTLN
jgi:hypothetical protein